MENLQPATPSSEKNMNFDVRESFEINSEQKTFEFKISFNEKIIFFEVEEKNAFPKEDFNIFLSLEELGKINRYFFQFETTKEVFNSLKSLISKKYLTIIKEERKMKIKIINPTNDKEFFINVPLKEKDLQSEMRSIIPYVQSLNEKIKNLENKVDKLENKLNEIYIYKNDLVEIIKQKEEKLLFEKYEIHKSNIIKKEEVKLLLSWLDKKNPSKIKLLLDSRIDGDTTETFYKKCTGKFPTVVLVQTTKGCRFGGYSSVPWKNLNGGKLEDKNSFIFSLDKQKKYNIKNSQKAIQTDFNYFAFGENYSDIFINDKCTANTSNYSQSIGTYDTTEEHELNGGEHNFTVLSYEVYQIEY